MGFFNVFDIPIYISLNIAIFQILMFCVTLICTNIYLFLTLLDFLIVLVSGVTLRFGGYLLYLFSPIGKERLVYI